MPSDRGPWPRGFQEAHTRRMRRSSWVGVFATVMACALVVVLLAVGRADRVESLPLVATDTAAHQDEGDDGDAGDPPPWARDGGKGKGGGHGVDKAWQKAWHELSPAQKEQKMTALAAAHDRGMTAWTDCMAAGGKDASNGGACEKPLPPGRAKKLP